MLDRPSLNEDVRRWLLTNGRMAGPACLPEDLADFRDTVEEALAALSLEFAAEGGLGLLSDLHLELILHARETPAANVDRATTKTDQDPQGRPVATIEMLALSKHPAEARTVADEPKDRDYFHRTVVHEMSMLFLWQITRRKGGGWRFFSAPGWFTDGYEDYLALTRSSTRARDVTLPRYAERARSRQCRDAAAIDRYVDGAMILLYLHERFGRSRVIALLRSTEVSFEAAAIATFGRTPDEILAGWRDWLCRGAV